MSGSPVYVDGKLIGAVSYALGSFSKEPIAGITPIAEMTDSTTFSDVRPPGARVQGRVPAHPREPVRRLSQGAGLEPAVRRPAERRRACRHHRGGRPRRQPARHAAASDRHAARDVRLRARSRRHVRRRLPRSGLRPDRRQRRRAARRREAVRRSAQAGRRRRRHAGRRRPDARRHRHGHAHRRRSRLRLRPPDVQPRTDRVPDDARLRLHRAAQPVLVDEAVDDGRDHRHGAAGSRDRDRRRLGAGPRHDSDHRLARVRPARRSRRSTSASSTIRCSDR